MSCDVMTDRIVDRTYVEKNGGVYFYLYSVPDVILTNRKMKFNLGAGGKIYHLSLLHSDGKGKIETITAGPEELNPLLNQLGRTPIKVQLSYLEHPDRSLIKSNFDSTAWNCQHIGQKFALTNWTYCDFIDAKNHVETNISDISSVFYNLGGHNSNSFITYIWKVISRTYTEAGEVFIDNPNEVFAGDFRPGSKHDLFDRSGGYIVALLFNYTAFIAIGALALWKIALAKLGRQ